MNTNKNKKQNFVKINKEQLFLAKGGGDPKCGSGQHLEDVGYENGRAKRECFPN